MKQFTTWQAPFYSFWSKSFYVDVAKNWHGLAYGYLFFLVCFTWIFMSIKKQMDFTYFADHKVSPLIMEMPTVTIEKGLLSIDKPSPYTIKDSDDQPVITFDTREKPISPGTMPGTFLITKDSIYGKNQPPEQKLDLSTMADHMVINQKVAQQFVTDFGRSIALIVFMIAVPIGFIFCILQSLIYGLIGLLMVRINKINLSYPVLVRLSAVAMTPVLLIDSIIKVRTIDMTTFTVWPIAAFIINIIYLMFAIFANIANQDNKSESSIS
jgi:Protein of unknown function (DUF1189)